MNKISVELGMPLRIAPKFIHKIPKLLPGILRHSRICLPLLFIQIQRLTVQLQFFFRFLTVLLQLKNLFV